ncbi:MAG: TetR/AcrR family transcriptional regulator [Solirubrobacteraceae bacterium]|nr:TetR/AcrR family transcriptional regulator [Solirubrobacteraceae bacterium]
MTTRTVTIEREMATSHPETEASSDSASSYKGTRPGGRSARVREAVIAAAAMELMEHGFADLSLTRVAERAGVAPTTVRRRWGTRARLVADMFESQAITAVPDPQLESLEADLRAFAAGVAGALGEDAVKQLLRGMFALPTEELAPIQDAYWQARVQLADGIVARAVERGELPAGTSGWAVIEPVLAPIWMRRLITDFPIDAAFLDRLVGDALRLARSAN